MRNFRLLLVLALGCGPKLPAVSLEAPKLLAPGEAGTALLLVRGAAAAGVTLTLDCGARLAEATPAELARGVRVQVPWAKAGAVVVSAGTGRACVRAPPLLLPAPPTRSEDLFHRAGFEGEADARPFFAQVLARQKKFTVPAAVRSAVAKLGLVPFGAARKPLQTADVDCDGKPDTLVLAVQEKGALGRAMTSGAMPSGEALAEAVFEVKKLDGDAFGLLVVVRADGSAEAHGPGEFEVAAVPKCDKGFDRAWALAHRCDAVDHGATESAPGQTLVFDHRSGRLVDVACE